MTPQRYRVAARVAGFAVRDSEEGRDVSMHAKENTARAKVRRLNAKKGEAVIDGVAPTKGMLLVSLARRKRYGVVERILDDGRVAWKSAATKSVVKSDPNKLAADGITYAPGCFTFQES